MEYPLSVIIPVFQAERYLDRCLRSVVSQTYKEISIIIINDGSTDNSETICNRWAALDSRIRVITQEKRGLSAARNRGIEESTSPYITFVDADDEIEPNTYATNMQVLLQMEHIDLLEFPVNIHYGSKRGQILNFKEKIIEKNILEEWIAMRGYTHCYAWNKIYKRALFDSVRFPVGESFEDAAIMPLLVERAAAVYISGEGCYLYYANNSGITRDYSFTTQEPLFRHNCNLLDRATSSGWHHLAPMLWITTLNLLVDLHRCSDSYRDKRYLTAARAYISAHTPPLYQPSSCQIKFRDRVKIAAVKLVGVTIYIRVLTIGRRL